MEEGCGQAGCAGRAWDCGSHLVLRESVRACAKAVPLLIAGEEGRLELRWYGARLLRSGTALPCDEAWQWRGVALSEEPEPAAVCGAAANLSSLFRQPSCRPVCS